MIARLLGIVIIFAIVFMVIWFFIHLMNRWRRREAIKEEKMELEKSKKGGIEK